MALGGREPIAWTVRSCGQEMRLGIEMCVSSLRCWTLPGVPLEALDRPSSVTHGGFPVLWQILNFSCICSFLFSCTVIHLKFSGIEWLYLFWREHYYASHNTNIMINIILYKIPSVDENMEQLVSITCKNAKWHNYFGKQSNKFFNQQLNMHLPYELGTLTVHMNPK